MCGDGDEPYVLEDADVAKADAIVAATGDDEDNLVVCLLGKYEYNVPLTIARINNPKNEWLFTEQFGVDVPVSQHRDHGRRAQEREPRRHRDDAAAQGREQLGLRRGGVRHRRLRHLPPRVASSKRHKPLSAGPVWTNAGRTSLFAILKALDLPPGAEVGVPLFCCSVVFDAIRQAGLKPRFIDSTPKTGICPRGSSRETNRPGGGRARPHVRQARPTWTPSTRPQTAFR